MLSRTHVITDRKNLRRDNPGQYGKRIAVGGRAFDTALHMRARPGNTTAPGRPGRIPSDKFRKAERAPGPRKH